MIKKKVTIKNGAYVINLDEYADVGTHWISLFCRKTEIVYFDIFGVEHVPEEIKEFIGNKNIKGNIFRVQASNSIMCGYFCIGLLILCLQIKNWLILQVFFLLMILKNNGIILSYLKDELNEVSKTEKYFNSKINQRKPCSKKLSKHVATFEYIDKILIVLFATSG